MPGGPGPPLCYPTVFWGEGCTTAAPRQPAGPSRRCPSSLGPLVPSGPADSPGRAAGAALGPAPPLPRPRRAPALFWQVSARGRGRGGRFPSPAVAAPTARRGLPAPPGRTYSMCSARPEPAMVLAPQRCSFSEMSFCKANRSRQRAAGPARSGETGLQPPVPRAPPAVLPEDRARCSLAGPGLALPESGRPGLERAKGARTGRRVPGHGQDGAAGEAQRGRAKGVCRPAGPAPGEAGTFLPSSEGRPSK